MYPKAYLDYLIYFHVERDYFECHEVLEEHWKKDPIEKRKLHWVALIQLAVGLYHHRRGNKKGAEIMYKRAASVTAREIDQLTKLGLNVPIILEQINKQLLSLDLNEEQAFTDIDLPFTDKSLLDACEKRCDELACEWSIKKTAVSDELLHKHTRRNLDAVIAERAKQLALRQEKRVKKN